MASDTLHIDLTPDQIDRVDINFLTKDGRNIQNLNIPITALYGMIYEYCDVAQYQAQPQNYIDKLTY